MTVVVYAVAAFLSAFLLFLVQPMYGRMVLPLLGGSASIWNACLLFFQGALLLGYLYAHATSFLKLRYQVAVHWGLLLLAGIFLPISVADVVPDAGLDPAWWLLLLMASTVGAPFIALSASGPLFQRWFAHTGTPRAANPYQLYAASNLGSLFGLLLYPLLVEPRLPIPGQSRVWTAGYIALAGLTLICVALIRHSRLPAPPKSAATAAGGPESKTTRWRERAAWVGFAFVPSSLLLASTRFVTTDLAPVPLLWVVPLALYLLSFTLVFAPRVLVPHRWMLELQPTLLVAVALLLLTDYYEKLAVSLPLHFGALFVTAMVAHGELARRTPAVSRLTEFYLWIAVGGALGGVFNVLVAPAVFPALWEYPITLVLACLARPWPPRRSLRDETFAAVRAVAFAYALLLLTREYGEALPTWAIVALAVGITVLLVLSLGGRPAWLAVALAGALGISTYQDHTDEGLLLADRSFYGHYRITRRFADGYFHVLQHGSTLHGAQSMEPDRRDDPLTYYVGNGPLGHIFAVRAMTAPLEDVAAVGLGAGSAAAYAEPGQRWTFFELDPGIARVARDTTYFSYLADASTDVEIELGDARLSLQMMEGDRRFDLIVLDAFSSDAVPVHLLTLEAVQLYLSRLAEEGWLAIHISNRYLDLEPVIAALARELGLAGRIAQGPEREQSRYVMSSTWVVLARDEAALGPVARDPGWQKLRFEEGVDAWTDHYSPILEVLVW